MAVHVVDRVLASVGAEHRSPAPGEWGLSLPDIAGAALHIGLREHDGLLHVQAEACAPAWAPDPHWLLHRGRLGTLVRYTHTSHGAVWVQCEIPLAALSEELVERVLAGVVLAAEEARSAGGRAGERA